MLDPDPVVLVPEPKPPVSSLVVIDQLTEAPLTEMSTFVLPLEELAVQEPADLITEPALKVWAAAVDDEEWITERRQPMVVTARTRIVRRMRITASLPRISPC